MRSMLRVRMAATTVHNHVWNSWIRRPRARDPDLARRIAPPRISRLRFRRARCRRCWAARYAQVRGTDRLARKIGQERTGIRFVRYQPYALGNAWKSE